ncbi:MAG: aminotransferase class I/II-fold pyridoxal phosphate-dependent enzyme [Nitriliruptor sp.]|nr:MAG: aminotransferase class I/II-fold pyridoxal phosphate-dependent enzyme [Nitriliruptor sp.]
MVVTDPLSDLSLDELRTRTSVKWRLHDPDVLPVWVAEMDAPLATAVVEALRDVGARGDTGYAYGPHYAQALAAFAAQRWDWDLPVEATALMPDVMRGCVEMLRLVTDPGDAVVVNPPVYPPFYGFIEHAGRRVVTAPLGGDGRIDLDVLAAAFETARAGDRPAAYLLCSPHNPTGTVHTRDELTAVAALAGEHGVRVVVDEIHAPLVLPGARFVPFLTVPGSERSFVLQSASKGWNLAGLKAAVAITGPEAAADLGRVPEVVTHGASHVGVQTHIAALRDGGAWLDAVREGIARNMLVLQEALTEALPEIRYQPGEGTYLAWLDCRELDLGDDPAAVFLERGRVALTGGLEFGPGGAGHARFNLATSPELIREAVRRMAAAV